MLRVRAVTIFLEIFPFRLGYIVGIIEPTRVPYLTSGFRISHRWGVRDTRVGGMSSNQRSGNLREERSS